MMRHVMGAGLFVGIVCAVVLGPARTETSTLFAADKDKDNSKQEQQLRKQINNLQGDLKQANNKIDNLQQELRERDQAINKLRAELKKEKKDDDSPNDLQQIRKELAEARKTIKEKEDLIASLRKQAPKDQADANKMLENLRSQIRELESKKNAPYVHSVIVRLKKDSPPEKVQALIDDVNSDLSKIPSIRGLWCGRRAEQASPDFADKTFTVGLAILFDDFDGLKRYLDHPLHKSFVDKHLKFWEPPIVYDFLKVQP